MPPVSAVVDNVSHGLVRPPHGRTVKVVDQGTGTPVVFLHSGVGSAGEWRNVFCVSIGILPVVFSHRLSRP
jgi:pimeloyl-ACP methyl ester carboxylesterase